MYILMYIETIVMTYLHGPVAMGVAYKQGAADSPQAPGLTLEFVDSGT